jgi:hypothetical protein
MDQRIFPLAAKLAMQTGEFREPFAIPTHCHAAGRCHLAEGVIEFSPIVRGCVHRHSANRLDTDCNPFGAGLYSPNTIPLTRMEGYC